MVTALHRSIKGLLLCHCATDKFACPIGFSGRHGPLEHYPRMITHLVVQRVFRLEICKNKGAKTNHNSSEIFDIIKTLLLL